MQQLNCLPFSPLFLYPAALPQRRRDKQEEDKLINTYEVFT